MSLFIQKPDDVVDEILRFVDLKKDNRIQEYLGENEIYNRDRKEDFFIAPNRDEKVLTIATEGV